MRSEEILQEIMNSLEEAQNRYHQLVLVVGSSGSGKTDILKQVAVQHKTSVVNVNLEISSQLLDLTVRQRKTQLRKIFYDMVIQTKQLIILDNLEILFDKELEQDPLRLLQHFSRNNLILASWNGTIQGGNLIYAEITHPEYRMYELSDTVAITIDKK